MSQTTETPAATVSAEDFERLAKEAAEARVRDSLRHGPCYSDGESAPLVWYDQVFERGITPAGSVACKHPLRVGATQNSLDVILVASHANKGNLAAASGATITMTMQQGDDPEGTFTDVGPSICVTAPAEGISAEPDHTLARFPLGNFQKPWLKIKLVFTGSITGGTCDAALSYTAR